MYLNPKRFINLLFSLLLFSCAAKKYDNPHIIIDTSYGDIEAELYPTKAPKSVAAILSYIDAGYYKNASFYRVLKDEDLPMNINYGIIQAGVWPAKKEVAGIAHEPTSLTGLTHTNGTLSLARTAVGTATTEFFICIGDETSFDAGKGTDTAGFAAFGAVVSGMDIVRKIQSQKNKGDMFEKKIIINEVRKL
jgi:peptidyl-prolyl cis-trans isomerase A (cyclophilin A)